MSQQQPTISLLRKSFDDFLDHQNEEWFVRSIGDHYLPGTLERLVVAGDRITRRAAVMGLGYLAEYDSNRALGRALVDRDRGVRTLAETAIRNVWRRTGTDEQRALLNDVVQYNDDGDYEQAVASATRLIHESPWIAEAWCQRGTAYYHLGKFEAAIGDCRQTLEINPYHFLAAAGIGQCYLRQNNGPAALEAFRRALRLNPNMEEVRARVIQLQKSLKED